MEPASTTAGRCCDDHPGGRLGSIHSAHTGLLAATLLMLAPCAGEQDYGEGLAQPAAGGPTAGPGSGELIAAHFRYTIHKNNPQIKYDDPPARTSKRTSQARRAPARSTSGKIATRRPSRSAWARTDSGRSWTGNRCERCPWETFLRVAWSHRTNHRPHPLSPGGGALLPSASGDVALQGAGNQSARHPQLGTELRGRCVE